MSGGSDKSAKQARKAEEKRLASISTTQAAINRVFNGAGREAEIADVVGALREQGTTELNEQKADTDRGLKFALARGGLIGGSTQLDQQRDLSKAYGKGLLDIERQAQGAGASLRAADQDARARLISLATSGLDATTAAQQSAQALRSNLETSRSTAVAQGVGDVFSSFKTFADQAREAQQRRQAIYDAGRQIYGPSAATTFAYGGQK